MRELRTPSRGVFAQGHNELFVQNVFQYSQEKEVQYLHYHILGLNESSIEDDMKKAYRSLDLRFHPDKKSVLTSF